MKKRRYAHAPEEELLLRKFLNIQDLMDYDLREPEKLDGGGGIRCSQKRTRQPLRRWHRP
jgi:hypothetical protein